MTSSSDPCPDLWSCPMESCEHLWERLEEKTQQIVKLWSEVELRKLTEKSLREILDSVGDIDARWKRYGVVKKSEVKVVKRTKLRLDCVREKIFFLIIFQTLFQHSGRKMPSFHVKHISTWRKIFSVMIFCDAIFENFRKMFTAKLSYTYRLRLGCPCWWAVL